MFDKNLFDRNAYDRSVSSDGINGMLFSTSSMSVKLVIAYPIPFQALSGHGTMISRLQLHTNVGCRYSGEGNVNNVPIILRLPLTVRMVGSGTLNPGLVAKTPFSLSVFGTGVMKSNQDFVYQHMSFKPKGQGDLNTAMIIKTPLSIESFNGSGDLKSSIILLLPLIFSMNGFSGFILRRIGALNENVFELDGINLMPGEEVTIDTDLLSVFFGYRQDVSSVTTDSVFFELSPGENDIIVDVDSNETITVTAIWQNRWL